MKIAAAAEIHYLLIWVYGKIVLADKIKHTNTFSCWENTEQILGRKIMKLGQEPWVTVTA